VNFSTDSMLASACHGFHTRPALALTPYAIA